MNAPHQPILRWRWFRRQHELTEIGQIVLWWELRRIPYNIIVGLLGVLTCFVVFETLAAIENMSPATSSGGWLGGPFLFIMGIPLYGIGANICYTGGWIVEIFAKRIWKERALHLGENSFALGLLFSAFLTLLPARACHYFLILNLLPNH